MAESDPLCVEKDCDRRALDGDARCALHSARLGPLARERPIPVVSPEVVLDAPSARVADPRRFRSASRLVLASLGVEAVSLGLLSALGAIGWRHSDVMTVLGALVFVTQFTSPFAAVHCLRQATTFRQHAFAWVTALLAFAPWLALLTVLVIVLAA